MRKFIFVVLLILMMCTGCSFNEEKSTIHIHTSYGGCGIDGKTLSSGSFDKHYSVKIDDYFSESKNGKWIKKLSDKYDVILHVKDINESGVIIEVGEEKISLDYGEKYELNSNYVIYDGINYNYEIYFE